MAHGETAHGAPTGEGLIGRPLQIVVVTPEATLEETTAEFLVLPLLDGELGIAPGHSPMIGRLGLGEMRVVDQGQTRRFYLDGGFVQVADNVVSVLTNHAIPAEKLDIANATQQLTSARALTANSSESLMVRERMEQQARAQLRVAQRAHGRHATMAGH